MIAGMVARAAKLGSPGAGSTPSGARTRPSCSKRACPVHLVAARCGHDPAVPLRIHAKRNQKGRSERGQIGMLTKTVH
jgi:hypothetical protein